MRVMPRIAYSGSAGKLPFDIGGELGGQVATLVWVKRTFDTDMEHLGGGRGA